jgi:benzoyl-CoA reductase/2-hydroxyglutaryl-CoA dehydratase subunit BcrC/BadD/HgdB
MSLQDVQRILDARLADPIASLQDGRRGAVGIVGPDVPIEILLASGRPFGHLPWQVGGGTPHADRWLESSFPYWARSILEQWHEGAFDAIETVVFSRADDASQRLFYYVRELQRRGMLQGPAAHMFDIALIPRESSVAHTAGAILELARTLEVDRHKIREGIDRANLVRAKLERIEGERMGHGPLHERLARAALWSDPTRWLDAIAMPMSQSNAPRVLLAGSMPPDDRLHRAVESGGACVIAEMHAHGPKRPGGTIAADDEAPWPALAQCLMQASVGPRAFFDRAEWILVRVESVRADAVVLWLTREDEALAWQVPAQQRALAAAGIPALIVSAAQWAADDGALERIADFCGEFAHAAT